ncbi:hypothetical protein K439DRAFT_1632968 [Ramaria rubella]|nr:hypothetical protein K439DRAFT_1632968 [Ramaria rubella]
MNPTEDFKLLKGKQSDLTAYTFNKKMLTHMSCPTCASAIFIEYDLHPFNLKLIAVNARSVRELDVQKLTVKMENGRALP